MFHRISFIRVVVRENRIEEWKGGHEQYICLCPSTSSVLTTLMAFSSFLDLNMMQEACFEPAAKSRDLRHLILLIRSTVNVLMLWSAKLHIDYNVMMLVSVEFSACQKL